MHDRSTRCLHIGQQLGCHLVSQGTEDTLPNGKHTSIEFVAELLGHAARGARKTLTLRAGEVQGCGASIVDEPVIVA